MISPAIRSGRLEHRGKPDAVEVGDLLHGGQMLVEVPAEPRMRQYPVVFAGDEVHGRLGLGEFFEPGASSDLISSWT